MTGFDHIDESGDLAGVEDDMWSHTDCLELSGQCHDLHRVCIKKDQRFICEHGKKNRLLFCERMIRCDTEIKILCINDAGVTLIDRGLFRIDDRNIQFFFQNKLAGLDRTKLKKPEIDFREIFFQG